MCFFVFFCVFVFFLRFLFFFHVFFFDCCGNTNTDVRKLHDSTKTSQHGTRDPTTQQQGWRLWLRWDLVTGDLDVCVDPVVENSSQELGVCRDPCTMAGC